MTLLLMMMGLAKPFFSWDFSMGATRCTDGLSHPSHQCAHDASLWQQHSSQIREFADSLCIWSSWRCSIKLAATDSTISTLMPSRPDGGPARQSVSYWLRGYPYSPRSWENSRNGAGEPTQNWHTSSGPLVPLDDTHAALKLWIPWTSGTVSPLCKSSCAEPSRDLSRHVRYADTRSASCLAKLSCPGRKLRKWRLKRQADPKPTRRRNKREKLSPYVSQVRRLGLMLLCRLLPGGALDALCALAVTGFCSAWSRFELCIGSLPSHRMITGFLGRSLIEYHGHTCLPYSTQAHQVYGTCCTGQHIHAHLLTQGCHPLTPTLGCGSLGLVTSVPSCLVQACCQSSVQTCHERRLQVQCLLIICSSPQDWVSRLRLPPRNPADAPSKVEVVHAPLPLKLSFRLIGVRPCLPCIRLRGSAVLCLPGSGGPTALLGPSTMDRDPLHDSILDATGADAEASDASSATPMTRAERADGTPPPTGPGPHGPPIPTPVQLFMASGPPAPLPYSQEVATQTTLRLLRSSRHTTSAGTSASADCSHGASCKVAA